MSSAFELITIQSGTETPVLIGNSRTTLSIPNWSPMIKAILPCGFLGCGCKNMMPIDFQWLRTREVIELTRAFNIKRLPIEWWRVGIDFKYRFLARKTPSCQGRTNITNDNQVAFTHCTTLNSFQCFRAQYDLWINSMKLMEVMSNSQSRGQLLHPILVRYHEDQWRKTSEYELHTTRGLQFKLVLALVLGKRTWLRLYDRQHTNDSLARALDAISGWRLRVVLVVCTHSQ